MSQLNVSVLGRNGLAKITVATGKPIRDICVEQGIDFETARVNGNPVSTSQWANDGDIITSVPAKEVTGNA